MAGTMFVSSFVYFYTYASFQYVHHSVLGTQPAASTSKHNATIYTMFIDLLIAFLAGTVSGSHLSQLSCWIKFMAIFSGFVIVANLSF